MKVRILPALSDNYMYLLVDESTKEAAVVDPVTPDIVVAAVEEEQATLTTVLTTHHHWDHAGGNKRLAELVSGLRFFGGDDRIDALTHHVQHGQTFSIGEIDVKCLSTPCHTKGHICYYVSSKDNAPPAVFTGDTLFLGGCGRFFEGDAVQMHAALIQVLATLPQHTHVYCGHEYSLQNLRFGLTVEPNNLDLQAKLAWAKAARDAKPPLPTVPSTIGDELRYNPFMRVTEASVQAYAGRAGDAVQTMKVIRDKKDHWKP